MTEDFTKFIEQMKHQRPVEWNHLPDFSLYMDQVLSYMERQLILGDGQDSLTAAMVNNYTKSGLVPRAEGKKYNREHIAYLTAVCVLKRVMATKDIDTVIRDELHQRNNVQAGYEEFCKSLDTAITTTTHEMESYADKGTLADSAIHFALLSYAASVATQYYVNQLGRQAGDVTDKK
ncbi:DUF1836 domain-containing protein [Bengtsoniella intestinalis]|uniref:DUF1836 domain-containing protein n=1 Tax=Bengtsoniella intestinalis TaxID=3073143 RepID=UPI00391F1716